ncbi:MAG: hypothetical protein OEW42_19380 [Acidimicrobiia bacterium]|nr:hypothetical protein [Acidimicrobiia bacterium]
MTDNKTAKNEDLTPNQRAVLERGRRMLAGWRRPIAPADAEHTGDPETDVDARNELLGIVMPGRPPQTRIG